MKSTLMQVYYRKIRLAAQDKPHFLYALVSLTFFPEQYSVNSERTELQLVVFSICAQCTCRVCERMDDRHRKLPVYMCVCRCIRSFKPKLYGEKRYHQQKQLIEPKITCSCAADAMCCRTQNTHRQLLLETNEFVSYFVLLRISTHTNTRSLLEFRIFSSLFLVIHTITLSSYSASSKLSLSS